MSTTRVGIPAQRRASEPDERSQAARAGAAVPRRVEEQRRVSVILRELAHTSEHRVWWSIIYALAALGAPYTGAW